MSTVKIIYGTGGGNTEIVCEKVKEILVDKGLQVEMLIAKLAQPEDLLGSDLLILASPTYGHGLLETYMEKLLKKSKDLDIKGQKCAIIGLGDATYDIDYFMEATAIIKKFLESKEADLIHLPLAISRSPIPHLEKYVPRWANEIYDKIQN